MYSSAGGRSNWVARPPAFMPSISGARVPSCNKFGRLVSLGLALLVSLGGAFAFRPLAKAESCFAPGVSLSLGRPDEVDGIRLKRELSTNNVVLLVAHGPGVSTNNLLAVAKAIAYLHNYDVRDDQLSTAVAEFERDYLSYLAAKGLVSSNSIDVTALAGNLEMFRALNQSELMTTRTVKVNGQQIQEYYVVRKHIKTKKEPLAFNRDQRIAINLTDVLAIANAEQEGRTIPLKAIFESWLRAILAHERIHSRHSVAFIYEPFAPQLSGWLDQASVASGLRYVVVNEFASDVGSICQSQRPHQDLMDMYEFYRKVLPLRKLKYPLPQMGEWYPGYLITTQMLKDKNFKEFFVSQQVKEFAKRNSHAPGEKEIKAFEQAAQEKMDNHTVTAEEYHEFLKQISAEGVRYWARNLYEKYFGTLPDLKIVIPVEVWQWFEQQTSFPASPIRGAMPQGMLPDGNTIHRVQRRSG